VEGEHQNLLAAKLKRFLMVFPSVLNQIQLDFDSINPVLGALWFLPITTAIRAGTRAGAGSWTGSWTGAITGTVALSVAVTTADTAAIAVPVTTLTTAAMTIAALASVAAAISSSVATSISTTAAVTATSISTTTTAAAGQDDFGFEGVISSRVQIGGEAFTGARRVDRTGCRAPGRYGCQK
jgi:hypothetical protein